MTSLAGVALPGNRKTGFITADTEGYTCSTSSRLTRDAISISWRVPLPSQNPKFTENPAELTIVAEKRWAPTTWKSWMTTGGDEDEEIIAESILTGERIRWNGQYWEKYN